MSKVFNNLLKYGVLALALLVVPILTACGKKHKHTYEDGICTSCHDGAVAYVELNEEKVYYKTLLEAVQSVESATKEEASAEGWVAPEPSKIVLFKDAEGDGIRIDDYRQIEFDFQGNTYTISGAPSGSAGTESSGFQMIKGTSVVFKNGTIKDNSVGVETLINNYTSIKFQDFTLDGTNEDSSKESAVVLSCRFGNSIVTGKSNIFAGEGKTGVGLYYGILSSYDSGVSLTFDQYFKGSVNGLLKYEKNANRIEGDSWVDKTEVDIENGTFELDNIQTTDDVKPNLEISGGTFAIDVSQYCADWFNCEKDSNNKFKVVRAENATNYVEIEGVRRYHETLEAALSTITEGKTAKIKLMASTKGKGFVVGNNKNIEFDLNGYTYTINEARDNTNAKENGIVVENGSKLSLVSTKVQPGYTDIESGKLISTVATSTMLTNNGTLEIKDVEIDGVKATSAVIENKAFATMSGASNIRAGSGRAALKITGDDENIKLILDEKFTGKVNGTIEKNDAEKSVLLIKGGTFNFDVDKYCEYLYESVLDSGTTIYKVKKATYALVYIERDGIKTYYATPELALESITNSDLTTIHLIDNLGRQGFRVRGNKNIILNLNEFEYRIANDNAIRIDADSSLTIKDGTVGVRRANITALIKNSGNLTIENVVVDGDNVYNGTTYTSTNLIDMASGTLEVLGNSNFFAVEDKGIFNVTGGEVSITSGTFSQDVFAYCPDFYECIKIDENQYEVVKVDANKVVIVEISGKKKYYTDLASIELIEGVDALIKINQDIIGEVSAFSNNANITLDLNGNTYTIVGTQGFTSTGTTKLLITNGAVTSTTATNQFGEGVILKNITADYDVDDTLFEIGWECVSNGEGKYVIKKVSTSMCACVINSSNVKSYYTTMKNAVDAASSGSTVYMFKSHQGLSVTITKDLTIDLCGNRYKVNTSINVKSGANVTFKNGSVSPYKSNSITTVFDVKSGTLNLENISVLGETITTVSNVDTVFKSPALITLANGTKVEFVGEVILTTATEINVGDNVYVDIVNNGGTLIYEDVTKYIVDNVDKTSEVKTTE